MHEFAQDGDIMQVVKRIKPRWKTPLLFKRQLLRSNIPNVRASSSSLQVTAC